MATKDYKSIPTTEKIRRGRACADAIRRLGHAQAMPYIRTLLRSMAVPKDESPTEREVRLVRESNVRKALLGRPSAASWPIIVELEAKLGL